ncbi:hypothetical protein TWF788_009050 [Orbilia oligospora]|uniref:Deacetylase sirtuin-type domain-containing protein n=2 Tax=Orbilia oligospora TaxID=2813651 RepID=A0A7C8Q2T8_ORBOL|nr:hypothetical protein TWF788_009050 [Orbilia oligospora]
MQLIRSRSNKLGPKYHRHHHCFLLNRQIRTIHIRTSVSASASASIATAIAIATGTSRWSSSSTTPLHRHHQRHQLSSMPYIEHDPTNTHTFKNHLVKSKRILALCGAGLSASSGLATFRGAGGLWRTHDAMSLATPQAFVKDPSLVWQFYSARRQAAFSAKPNAAHLALAALSVKHKDFITVTQNVDGLSPRAGHPPEQLYPVHGSLSTIKCTSIFCSYTEHNNFKMALTPALAPSRTPTDLDAQPPTIPLIELPYCPKCGIGMMRPGVVWFNETLPNDLLESIDDWIDQGPIDLCLVIGTTGQVWPAAGYIEICRGKGAKVAVINMEIDDNPHLGGVKSAEWLFKGDCAQILPDILQPIIGSMDEVRELLGDTDKFPPTTFSGGPVTDLDNNNDATGGTGEGTGYY